MFSHIQKSIRFIRCLSCLPFYLNLQSDVRVHDVGGNMFDPLPAVVGFLPDPLYRVLLRLQHHPHLLHTAHSQPVPFPPNQVLIGS